jgi:hypothetical protein
MVVKLRLAAIESLELMVENLRIAAFIKCLSQLLQFNLIL